MTTNPSYPHPTPGFLRGTFINEIVGAMHTAGRGGPWAIDRMTTENIAAPGEPEQVQTTMIFAVGIIHPDTDMRYADGRPRVTVTVRESSGK